MNYMEVRSSRIIARRAFSLIELLIVIAILLLLGGIVALNYSGVRKQASNDVTLAHIDRFEAALEMFENDMGRLPTSEEGLTVLWNSEVLEEEDDTVRWRGPYLRDGMPSDDWGSSWVYRAPGDGEIRGESYYDIVSVGPDKEIDTEDDIHNHLRAMNSEGEIDEAMEFSIPESPTES